MSTLHSRLFRWASGSTFIAWRTRTSFQDRAAISVLFAALTFERCLDSSELRLVAQVRDPRDCIISLYYSLIYSHPPPAQGPAKEKYQRNLAVTQSADLETFVRKQARQYAVRMHVLQDVFQRAQNGILLRYETMVGAPPEWLSALCEFLRIDLSPQIANWVSKEMCTNDLVEDVSRHKRQVFPGDFRRKLTASMQDQLTSMLRPHLDAFGYS